MAIFRRSPDSTHFRIVYEILREGPGPVLISDGAGVRFAFDDCVEDFDLAGAGVTVLSNVEIEANGRDVPRRIDAILFQKVEGKNSGLSRIAAAERDALTFEIAQSLNTRFRTGNNLTGETDVYVTHCQNPALTAGATVNFDVGEIRVPCDIDPSIQQRVTLGIVV